MAKIKQCEGCKLLRKQLVEALEKVDTTDWDSYSGSNQRSISSVLSDIAARLDALGKENEKQKG